MSSGDDDDGEAGRWSPPAGSGDTLLQRGDAPAVFGDSEKSQADGKYGQDHATQERDEATSVRHASSPGAIETGRPRAHPPSSWGEDSDGSGRITHSAERRMSIQPNNQISKVGPPSQPAVSSWGNDSSDDDEGATAATTLLPPRPPPPASSLPSRPPPAASGPSVPAWGDEEDAIATTTAPAAAATTPTTTAATAAATTTASIPATAKTASEPAAMKPATKTVVAARVPPRFPPSRVGPSQPPAVSWADDGSDDQVSATTTPSPSPFAPPPSGGLEQRPQMSAWGDDDDNDEKEGGGDGGVTAASPLIRPPVRASAWGDDSDDDGVVDARPSQAPTPSGPSKTFGDTDGVVVGHCAADRADRAEGERLLDVEQASPVSRAPTAWGSDEPDHSSSPSRHSRPFRTVVAAAVPPPRPSVSSPMTSWENDGEGDVSRFRPPLSRPFPVQTTAAAAPATTSPLAGNNNERLIYYPAGQLAGRGGGGDGGGDHGGVIAPLSGPFAHQDSGPDERLLSWADEDEEAGGSFGGGGGGDTGNIVTTGGESNLRGQDNPRRSSISISPARTPTTPGAGAGAFAFDFAGRTPLQRRETLALTYPAGRSSTPSTTAPSPWPNSPQGYLARETATRGGEGGYPSSLDSSTSPTHGDGGWGGRRFTYTYSAGLSPRLGPVHAPGGSPSSPPLRLFNYGSRWQPRQDRDGGNDNDDENENEKDSDKDNDNGDDAASASAAGKKKNSHGEPQKLTPLPATSGGGGWLQRAKGLFSRQRGSVDGDGDGEEDGGPNRKRSEKKNKKGGSGKKGDDDDSGVRTWTFWDNFRSAPGLIARLCVCILAVCALWATSLSVAVDVTSSVVGSPTLNEVISAVVHAYYIIEEQRKASKKCVDHQSVYCDSDLAAFEISATGEVAEKLALTEATYQQAKKWTESCGTSVLEAEVSLKTWLAQGTGHTVLYADDAGCEGDSNDLIADLLGDITSSRDDLASVSEEFAEHSVSKVSALSSYALERTEYDAAYLANTTEGVDLHLEGLIDGVAFDVPDAISSTLESIADRSNVLVSCVSLRGDVDGASCPLEGARALADAARAEADTQLARARAGFQEYEENVAIYTAAVDTASENFRTFFNGAYEALFSLGWDFTVDGWSSLTMADFFIIPLHEPSSNLILNNIEEILTAEEIWDRVESAYSDYAAGLADSGAAIIGNVTALRDAWVEAAALAFSNTSISLQMEDYDPPRYGNSSTPSGSAALLEAETAAFEAVATKYSATSSSLLDNLGPAAPNLSLPASPALNFTLELGGVSLVASSPIEYTFAAFASGSHNFDWAISAASIATLLVVADYIFRFSSSVRLFVRFWGRAGLGLPDADMRVDKDIAASGSILSSARKGAIKVLLHPVTGMLFFSCVLSIVAYNLSSLYLPLYDDYRAGCVQKTQNGSFFSQNVYSIAYNYAADEANRDTWNFQEDHTSRRGSLCAELTEDVQQYILETDFQLRAMYEAHYEHVTQAALFATCLDTAGMDDLYEEACCGHDGYNATCTANSTLKCPLNYASGVGTAFGRTSIPLSDDSCAEETLEEVYWQVESNVDLDCDTIPTCHMSCDGPNKELLLVITMHAGCMVEWLIHASWLKGVAVFTMFVFLNLSRVVIVGGVVKLNWKRMHSGIFTYKGTCTRSGELMVKRPEQKAEKSKKKATAATATARRAKATKAKKAAASRSSSGSSSCSSNNNNNHKFNSSYPLARAKARLAAVRAKQEASSPPSLGRGKEDRDTDTLNEACPLPLGGGGSAVARSVREAGDPAAGAGGAVGRGRNFPKNSGDALQQEEEEDAAGPMETEGGDKAEEADEPKREPPTFKQVIAGAVEECLEVYEKGARLKILGGILLNVPWVVVLYCIGGGKVVYRSD